MCTSMKQLVIINENSRSSNYGIGTYINQLIKTLKNEEMNLYVVNIFSNKYQCFHTEKIDNIQYFHVPIWTGTIKDPYDKKVKRYYENIIYILKPYLIFSYKTIFHINLMHSLELAKLLKKYFNCTIVTTVHYMDWSFSLLGDKSRLKSILKHPESKYELSVKNNFEKEFELLNYYTDKVIAIALHSYKTLLNDYKIKKDKISLIPHCIEDKFISLSIEKRRTIREKYGIYENSIVIIYAGRIDPVKGVDLLIEAFVLLRAKNKKIKLIIAGDGNILNLLEKAKPFWSSIIFTGYLEKDDLYELFSISDIGVIPSRHEEFGYVAIEMMMMGLPLVVSNSTGLNEIVINKENGLTTIIHIESNQNKDNILNLSNNINNLINNISLRYQLCINSRTSYINNYTLNIFKNNMKQFYNSIY